MLFAVLRPGVVPFRGLAGGPRACSGSVTPRTPGPERPCLPSRPRSAMHGRQLSLRLARPAARRPVGAMRTSAYGLPDFSQGDGVGFKAGWTKSNELILARLAMFSFAGSLLGEQITGRGILGQIGLETGIPLAQAQPLLLAFIATNWALVLIPGAGEFSLSQTISNRLKGGGEDGDEEEGAGKEAVGGLSANNIALGLLQEYSFFLGDKIGMTKENELLIGRLAQGGYMAALMGEVVTGRGPLGQLGLETGIGMEDANPFLLLLIFILVAIAISNGTGRFVNE